MTDWGQGHRKRGFNITLYEYRFSIIISKQLIMRFLANARNEVFYVTEVLALKEPDMNNPRRKRLCTQPHKPGVGATHNMSSEGAGYK